jgi:hypothetical protein
MSATRSCHSGGVEPPRPVFGHSRAIIRNRRRRISKAARWLVSARARETRGMRPEQVRLSRTCLGWTGSPAARAPGRALRFANPDLTAHAARSTLKANADIPCINGHENLQF